MTSKHTNAHSELPWDANDIGYADYLDGIQSQYEVRQGNQVIAYTFTKEDTDFIVQAVNQYYENKALIGELARLLEDARPHVVCELTYKVSAENKIIKRFLGKIDAALSKAKEPADE